jgi:flagella basal body P-ring formation protein FlgA
MRCLMLLPMLACLSQVVAMRGVASEVDTLPLALATRELQAVLQERYSDVTQWSVHPVASNSSPTAWPEGEPTSVVVTRAGARSAVRLTWKRAATAYVRTLWFDVSGMAPAVVAARDAPPGALLSSSDGELAERDRVGVSCVPVVAPEELQSMRTKRALRNRTVICREAIEPRPAVARGEDVLVRFVSDSVSIVSRGIAQGDAHVGQRVSVINAASHDAFIAVASALKEVVVHE